MRNLKKFLALVLAMMMVFSLMVTVNASYFEDVGETNDYYKAIEILHGMNVFTGYEDGNFHPEKDITRAEVAAILYRAHSGDVITNAESYKSYIGAFSDTNGHWAAGYINYASMAGLIEGYGDGRFGPNDKVTGYQVITMFLRAIGYGKKPGEFQGSTWYKDTANRAAELHITDGIVTDLTKPATRELVAELVFRTIAENYVVAYTPALDYYTEAFASGSVTRDTLAHRKFGLRCIPLTSKDVWGTPVENWIDDGLGENRVKHTSSPYAQFDYKQVAYFEDTQAECELYEMPNQIEGSIERVYVDGVWSETETFGQQEETVDLYAGFNRFDVDALWGGQGIETAIYDLSSNTYFDVTDGSYKLASTEKYRVVEINTWLGKVTKVNDPEEDRGGHWTERTVDFEVYNIQPVTDGSNGTENEISAATVSTLSGVESKTLNKGDYVTMRISGRTVVEINIAYPLTTGEIEEWEAADYPKAANTTINKDENYKDADKFYLNLHADGNWDFLDDGKGNIIGQGKAAYKLAVLSKIAWISKGGISEEEYAEAELIPLEDVGSNSRAISANGIVRRVDKLNGEDVEMMEGVPEDAAGYEISDSAKKNGVFSGHVVVYSENDENGTVNIITHEYDAENGSVYFADYSHFDTAPALNEGDTAAQASITRGYPDIKITVKSTSDFTDEEVGYTEEEAAALNPDVGTVIGTGNKNTVYYVQQENGTYQRYDGMYNVPSVTGTVCILADENGYAVLVIVSNPDTSESRTFVAFVPFDTFSSDTAVKGSKKIKNETNLRFNVYELGKYGNSTTSIFGIPETESEEPDADETGALVVPDGAEGDPIALEESGAGLYEITVDGYNRVTDIAPVALNGDANTELDTDYYFAEAIVASKPDGDVLIGYTDPTPAEGESDDLVIDDLGDSTGYRMRNGIGLVKVTIGEDKDGNATYKLTQAKTKDLNNADKTPLLVVVVYTQDKKGNKDAEYVYIIDDGTKIIVNDDGEEPGEEPEEPGDESTAAGGIGEDVKPADADTYNPVGNVEFLDKDTAYQFDELPEWVDDFSGDPTVVIYFPYTLPSTSKAAQIKVYKSGTTTQVYEWISSFDTAGGGHCFYFDFSATSTDKFTNVETEKGLPAGKYDFVITATGGAVLSSGTFTLTAGD